MGLTHQAYPELIKTKQDLTNIEKLVGLETKFNSTMELWGGMLWGQVRNEFKDMQQKVSDMNFRCKRIPEHIQKLSTYTVLVR